ncbi:MAG: NAD(P)H-hydrate dehydratase [Saprospiraceae bacterium]
MKPIFSFNEVREAEKRIIEEQGVPSLLLMENAGKNSCEIILKQFPDLDNYKINIICGKGNNAGDGFVLARHLIIKGYHVTVVLITEPDSLKDDARINFELLFKQSLSKLIVISLYEFKKNYNKNGKSLIVDAVLGTGIKRELESKFKDTIECVNKCGENSKTKVISLDVPSGLSSDGINETIVNADLTVTMGCMKTELMFGSGKENSGDIEIADIGIDETLFAKYNSYKKYITDHTDAPFIFPKRKKVSHKYSNGKVLFIGGSKGLSGAVMLSSISTLKSGAGAVAAGVPKSVYKLLGKKLFEVMMIELDENKDGTVSSNQSDKLKKRINWADCVLLGPGLSINDETKEFVKEIISNCEKNLVIDADGLNNLAEDLSVLKNRKTKNDIILTPHIGEFSRLAKVSVDEIEKNRFEIVRAFVSEYKVNLVLKSETTITCDINCNIFINPTGNESLATAGSGDVLSGIIASLFARSKDAKMAMLCGNYLHGLASDIYAQKKKNKQSATPRDIIEMIPEAISEVL